MMSFITMPDTSPPIQNMNSGDNWYVAYTRHMCEKKVSERLIANEIVHYLPLYTVVHQWSDRKKKVEKPLISSVVFIKLKQRELNKIYSIPGINGLLQFNGKPAIVKEHEIQNLRILLQEVHADELEQVTIKAGDLVEVIHGPFQGMQAYAMQMQNNIRLIIEIKSMGIGFSVNVPKTYVKRL
jgi:transcription antitermination factor NusG